MNNVATGKLVRALVLLLLGAVAGYYFGFDIGWNRALERHGIVPESDQESSVTGETTFTSSEYNFSFVYEEGPDGYVLREEPEDGGPVWERLVLTLIETGEWEALQEAEGPREGPPAIGVTVYVNPEDWSLERWVEESAFYPLGGGEIVSTAIAGEDALQYRYSGLYEGEVFVVTHGEYIYQFTVNYFSPTDAIRTDFENILDSVTFDI